MTDDKLEQALLARNPDSPKPPPTPDIFLPDPPAVGGKDFAKAVYQVLKDYPGAKRSIPRFVHGPTWGSMYTMQQSKLPIEDFEDTTLLGITERTPDSKNYNEIGINPGLKGDYLKEVLAHEIAHTEGAGEVGARIAQAVYADALKQRKAGKAVGPRPQPAAGMEEEIVRKVINEIVGSQK